MLDYEAFKSLVNNTLLDPLTNRIPVGAICNKEVYKITTGLTHYNEFINQSERDGINFFRTFLNDGNGFYRAVMFGYLENNIFNKNIMELKKLVYDIHETIEKPLRRKNFNVSKYDFLAIIIIIIEYLEENKIEQAYGFFVKCYYVVDWFDKVKYHINVRL